MAVKPLTGAKFREFDQNGEPLAGGKLYTYAAGTTNPLATYTDASGSVANSNPVLLDAAGRAAVWLQPGLLYKFVLKDASNVVQYTEDNFPAQSNVSDSSSAVATDPGGRISLTSEVAVTTADVTDAASIYYVPYKSNLVPLYDGTDWALWSIGSQLSQTVTDNTKSPAAVAANSNYDLFVWNDSGVIRLSRGPAWSSDTSRGTGIGTTELVRVDGRLVNKVAITNGPGANLGLYVGTVYIGAAALACDSSAGLRFTWNMYNRVARAMQVLLSTVFYGYSTDVWRQANNSAANQLDFVVGIAEDEVEAYVAALASCNLDPGAAQVGIGVDSTTTPSGLHAEVWFSKVPDYRTQLTAQYKGIPGVGHHYLAWLERGSGAGMGIYISWYGDTAIARTGIIGTVFA